MVFLTRQERGALLFLFGMGLVGTLVHGLCLRQRPQVRTLQRPMLYAKMDINTASVRDIVMTHALPAKLAVALVSSRTKQGPFASMEEVRRVKGIKEARLRRLERYFYVPDGRR